MRLFRVMPASLTGLCVLVLSLSAFAAPAVAMGTATVRQSDGDTDVYHNVQIKVLHNALYVTTADGKGTIVISQAACSYQGQLMVCFATHAALVQSGTTKALDLKKGTIYANNTDDPQPMTLTTAKVPPHSIVLSMETDAGTYISLNGRVDKVVK